jgi:hypothetical protein
MNRVSINDAQALIPSPMTARARPGRKISFLLRARTLVPRLARPPTRKKSAETVFAGNCCGSPAPVSVRLLLRIEAIALKERFCSRQYRRSRDNLQSWEEVLSRDVDRPVVEKRAAPAPGPARDAAALCSPAEDRRGGPDSEGERQAADKAYPGDFRK